MTESLQQFWSVVRNDALDFLHHSALKVAIILLLAVVLIRMLRVVTHRLVEASHRDALPGGVRGQQLRTLASVMNSVGMLVIVFLTALEVLPVFGVDMKPLLASAGIAGLAIGFGAQTLVKDFLNGCFILLENQYDIGDSVRLAGVQGTVEDVTLRRTLLRDDSGALHEVPNGEVRVVTNLTRDWAQISLQISVAFDEPSERVLKLLRETATALRNDEAWRSAFLADPEVPGIERMGAGEAVYLVVVRTVTGKRHAVARELRRRIKENLVNNRVRSAGPMQVYLSTAAKTEQVE